MQRDYLFLSGEFSVSMPITFERENWTHSMSPSILIMDDGHLRRKHIPNEQLKGVIHYADLDNKELERSNLQLLIDNCIPCWPNPKTLIKILDRHKLLQECIEIGNIKEPRLFQVANNLKRLPYPFVVKTGNSHRGIGKYLVKNESEMPTWEGMATIEPFWEGTSIRILIIGDRYFSYKYENENSWIKNSQGAEIGSIDIIPDNALELAFKLTKYFELDISGCDFIINKNGEAHFLEINQVPGIGVRDDIIDVAKSFLRNKMDTIEKGTIY